MPIKNYGVLIAHATDRVREGGTDTPHYQILARMPEADLRVAVNVLSKEPPSELLFVANDDFRHPVTDLVASLEPGWHDLVSRPATGALDFIRGNLFDPAALRTMPPNVRGTDNDLADLLDHYINRAIGDPDALLYAFGQRWGPEAGAVDKVFGFTPDDGVHQIHMNQGNSVEFFSDDGVWQDGGIFVHLPSEQRWISIFLAFQSQKWHTDDATGHSIDGPGAKALVPVRVLAARVNPIGPATEQENVLLINASADEVQLDGWVIADKAKATSPIPGGLLSAGSTLEVDLRGGAAALGNKGGQISIIDAAGLKVHGVAYTALDAANEGWTVTF